MINQEILQKIKDIVSPCVKNNAFELIEIKYHGKNRLVLTILIDRAGGGITIDECALMNRLISEVLDSADILSGGYILEVSSPGVDRLLKDNSDFRRVINKKVRCFLIDMIEHKQEIEGMVKEANSESVIFDTRDGLISIPYSKIKKARQIIE